MICRKKLFALPDSEAEQSNQQTKSPNRISFHLDKSVRAFFIKRGD